MSLAGQHAAMIAIAAWLTDHPAEIQADLETAATNSEGASPELVSQLGEFIIDQDVRDAFLWAAHSWTAGYLRGYEAAYDGATHVS